jgi:hypothetical protein
MTNEKLQMENGFRQFAKRPPLACRIHPTPDAVKFILRLLLNHSYLGDLLKP